VKFIQEILRQKKNRRTRAYASPVLMTSEKFYLAIHLHYTMKEGAEQITYTALTHSEVMTDEN